MLETLQGDLGCNRRVGGLCSCFSYQMVHLEVRYVKLNLAMNEILKFGLSSISTCKGTLTTSTKMSPLHIVTTGVVLSFKAKKVVINSSFNGIIALTLKLYEISCKYYRHPKNLKSLPIGLI